MDQDATREVPTTEGARVALTQNAQFVETSAQEGTNVDEAFKKLVMKIILEIDPEDSDSEKDVIKPTPKPSELQER